MCGGALHGHPATARTAGRKFSDFAHGSGPMSPSPGVRGGPAFHPAVHGNSSVLRVNYRNSHETIAAAMACTGSEQVDDLGESYQRGDDEVRGVTTREGVRPCLVRGGDFGGQIRFVAETARRLAASANLDLGDIGVLAPPTRWLSVPGADSASSPSRRAERHGGRATILGAIGDRRGGPGAATSTSVASRCGPTAPCAGNGYSQTRSER